MEVLDLERHILIWHLGCCFVTNERKIAALQATISKMTDGYENYRRRVISEFATNNWRKFHNIPMRRKSR